MSPIYGKTANYSHQVDCSGLKKEGFTYIHIYQIFVFHSLETFGSYLSVARLTEIVSLIVRNIFSIQIFDAQILKICHVFSDFQEILRRNLSVVKAERFKVSKMRESTHCLWVNVGAAKIEHLERCSAVWMNHSHEITEYRPRSI